MIQFKNLRQYSQVVNGLRFPNVAGQNVAITYLSENSTLLEDHSRLNIRLVDVKITVVPITMIPRTRLNPTLIKNYKSLGLLPYSSVMKVPSSRNVYFDLSQYLTAIDDVYKPSNYRQRAKKFIQSSINKSFDSFPDFTKILLYTVDVTKPELKTFIDRKSFPILEQLKNGDFDFDHLLLCIISASGPKYRLLVKDRSFKLPRIITYLKSIRLGKSDVDEDEGGEDLDSQNTDQAVDIVMDKLSGKISPSNHDNVQGAIKKYLAKDIVSKEKVLSNTVTPDGMSRIGTASILYNVNRDIHKTKKIVNSVSKKKLKQP